MNIALKLRQKIYSLSVISGLFFVLISAIAYHNFSTLSESFNEFSQTSHFAKQNISLAKDIERLKTNVQKYTYTGYKDAAVQAHRLYVNITETLNKSVIPKDLAVASNFSAIKTHLGKYYTTFITLEKQIKERNKLRKIKSKLQEELDVALKKYFKQSASSKKPISYEIKGELYKAEKYALLFLTSLENRYIKLTRNSFRKASTLIQQLLSKQKNNPLLNKISKKLKRFSKTTIKEIQRTRGYIFLVNVVMAAEAYEVLFNANIISDASKQILEKIDQDVDRIITDSIQTLTYFSLFFLFIMIILALIISRNIVHPLGKLTNSFIELAEGNTNAVIPFYQTHDEIGKLTNAAQSFLSKNIEIANLLEHSKKLSKNLSFSEERFSLALEGAEDGLWDWDLTTDKVFYSTTWKHMFGYENHEVEDNLQEWKDKVHPDDTKAVLKDIQDYLERKTTVYESEMRILCKDGSYKYILSRGKAIFDAQGYATRMLGFHIDMSDQKNLEKNLLQAKEQADKANQAKSDFLANMSHEIRTPLNGIIGLTDLVLKTDLNEKQNNYLSKSKTSSLALLRVINDILDYSKIEAGKLDLEYKTFDIDIMMENIKDLFEYQATQKGIKLHFATTLKKHTFVIGDSLRLTQILTNLVGNALKFTDKGSIDIDIKQLKDDKESMKLQFSVKDSGIGINPDVQKKLFSEFSQADTSITREYGGTGLGLAISKQLVHMMDGVIWIESEEGEGSEFFFTAYFTKADENDQTQTAPVQTEFDPSDIQLLKGIDILLVEDNKTNQLVICGILEEYAVNISIANNGQEAVDMAKSKTYDVVLMDLQMPIMDGFKATKIIRTYKEYQQTPIFALSAAVMQKDKELTHEAGMDEHLAKPIEYKVFIQTLIDYVKIQKAI